MRCFPTAQDSDQSISDEEELDQDCPNKCATLPGPADKKEKLPLSSRLEMLKGAAPCNLEDDDVSSDEEINVPSKSSVAFGAKELRKDDVHGIGGGKEDGSYEWLAASKEAEALVRLNEKTTCSSSHSAYWKLDRSSKGIKGKGKPKFSFHFPTHKDEGDISFKVQELPKRLETIHYRNGENSDMELLEDVQGEEENQMEIVPVEVNELGRGSIEQSMAELLDGLQDKTTMPRRNFKMYNRKRCKMAHHVVKRVSTLGDRLIDIESSPEHLGPGLPSDSEADDHILKLDKPEMKGQTLVDRFQEALSDRTLVAVAKPLRIGLFGQLQQVMQSEKENDMEFLKNIEEGTNQTSCIDVKILSRYLDAKLTVCHCSFGNNLKRLPWAESSTDTLNEEESTWTVIFNPRVCNDVDLDVGKLIRIHHPWKEVHVGNGKSTILSCYFSDISI